MAFMDDFLHRFDAKQSEDPVKTDLELTCGDCGAVVCDIEADDNLKVLVQCADDHVCADEEDEPGSTCTYCGQVVVTGDQGLLVDTRTGDWWCRANPSNGGDAAPHEVQDDTRSPWPETDEERVAFVDWQHDVGEGNTNLGFRDWLDHRAEEDEADEEDDEYGEHPYATYATAEVLRDHLVAHHQVAPTIGRVLHSAGDNHLDNLHQMLHRIHEED